MINPLTADLVKAAAQVRENAYAPYSGYKVGAAILDDQNRIHVGCNVENISYGGAICAERSAVTRMIAEGGTEIRSVVVVTKDAGTPCGFCRQVLAEFAPNPEAVTVFMVRADDPDNVKAVTLADLIPFAFTSSEVGRTAPAE